MDLPFFNKAGCKFTLNIEKEGTNLPNPHSLKYQDLVWGVIQGCCYL
jgi:hypothetical protein